MINLTDISSFNMLASWLLEMKAYSRGECKALIVGNFAEESDKRAVKYKEVKKIADEHGRCKLLVDSLNRH